jgi:hypothetical protein
MPTSAFQSWAQIIVAALSLLGAVSVASLSYYFSSKKQIAEEQRKVKVEVYEGFYRSILDVARDPTIDNQKQFFLVYDRLLFVGSDNVVEKSIAWLTEIRTQGNKGDVNSPKLRDLLDTMRRDLGISKRPVLSQSGFVPITSKP